MRFIACFIVGIFLVSCCWDHRTEKSSFPQLKKADDLFEKGTFQTALKEYEMVFKTATDPEVRWMAFFRVCESLTHLYRYGEAAQLLVSTPLPQEIPFKARVLILRAELLQNFLTQYSYIQGNEVVEGEGDVFRLTKDQVRVKIRSSYRQLWDLREDLVRMPVEDEGYFLDIKDVDFTVYPTMFDYLIYSWTNYLYQWEAQEATQKSARPDGSKLIVEKYERPVSFGDPPALLAAELMEEAGRFEKRRHKAAAELWRIKRLMQPVFWSGYYELKDVKASRKAATEILLGWFSDFKTRYGRAEAGYRAADLLAMQEEYVEAVKICRRVEKKYSRTYSGYQALVLREQIEEPTLALEARSVMPPGRKAFTLTTKNLKKIHFRLYRVDPDELRGELREKYDATYFYGWSGLLGVLHRKWLEATLAKGALKTWSQGIIDKGDYKPVVTPADPPDLEKGIYLAVASPDSSPKLDDDLVSATFLNVSDLVLIGTGGVTAKTRDAYETFLEKSGPESVKDQVMRLYAVDAKTGRPVENAGINTFISYGGQTSEASSTTGKEGEAPLAMDVKLRPPDYSQGYYYGWETGYNFDPLAKKDGAYSYWQSGQYVDYSSLPPVVLFLEMDRPIYRPGHKASVKVVGVWRSPQGMRTLSKKESVSFKAYDTNGKEFFGDSAGLNDMGSARVDFQIPQGKLLGQYRVEAECTSAGFTGKAYAYFSVEEYKQPEFEITLEPAKKPWKYGQPVEISGSARYYFGGPVPGAAARYVIKRQVYIPWYYRYWFGDSLGASGEEVATGEMKTDEKGGFIVKFTPTAPPIKPYQDKVPEIAEFVVEVEGHDSGGRTVQASQTYRAGRSALYFVIEPRSGFFTEGESVDIDSKLMTINDTPSPGEGTFEVFRLADEPAKPLGKDLVMRYGSQWGWQPPLDVQLKDVKNGKLAGSGTVEHGEEGKGALRLAPLAEGTYRIVEKTADPWGGEVRQEKIFVVAPRGKGVPVNAATVTIPERNEYAVGDTARFVIGSGLGSGVYHVETWAGQYLVKSELIDGKDLVRLFEVPVTEQMKGGLTVRWFGVKDFEVCYGQGTVSVPWSEKKLTVELAPFTDKLTPGETVTWGIGLKDAGGKPAKGEVLALMYDRALEYYQKSSNAWLDTLYVPQGELRLGYDSAFPPRVTAYSVTRSIFDKIKEIINKPPEPPKPPGLRTWSTWAEGRGGGFVDGLLRSRGLKYDEGMPAPTQAAAPMEEKAAAPAKPGLMLEQADMKAKKGEAGEAMAGGGKQAPQIEARKAFADTAFFHPQIATAANGSASMTFTAPGQLTSWRVKMLAFTQDAKEGTLVKEVVTRKELMVRADIPRFFREKDKGTVTAVVHNESEGVLEGDLFIDITQDGKSINETLGLIESAKRFTVQPHALQSFDWLIEVPAGIATYKVKVSAVSGKLSDAEERELPILPSRQRLIESTFASLSGKVTKKLEIKLKDDPTRINESMVVQLDPQLTLSLLNTIPFLVEYPYECVEQILNKYVPLAIINEIYKKYPSIKKATAKIPKRESLTPAWEQDDPRRLITLMETPWVRASEGYKTSFPMIDLLDPAIVEAEKVITIDKLRAAQLPSGAFPWWPGGLPDPYMTLYVLGGFAEARRYGVDVPEDMIDRALGYVISEIPSKLKEKPEYLAITAYAAYVVTSYPAGEFSQARKGHEEAKSWVKFLQKHAGALTPFGKAYLAYTYYRLGDKQKAGEVLDMAMDGAQEDPIVGVYWTPEKYSWVWYSDSVEKHAFLLRTLQELRPGDKKIPGMVQWLLFNRKGNVWKSTKASSAAVYALLDYLEKTGAMVGKDVFKVQWGKVSDQIVVKADDWYDEPIRWVEEGFDITPQMQTAEIQKDGSGIALASMTWIYSTDQLPEASAPGLLVMERKFYRRVKEADAYHLKPIGPGDKVAVGDEIVVQVKVNARSQFEYMHLQDPKAAGFEAETLLSGWKFNPLSYYEEPRDSLTNFFISWLPQGEYIMSTTLRPTKPGTYRIGAAILQSMYAPEMTAHSAGFIINVVK